MYIASNDIKKIHASSGLKNLRFSKYFDDVTRVWSNLKVFFQQLTDALLISCLVGNCVKYSFYYV